ncbi:MAG: CBS domain-containing protein [Myxococcota bacterium]|nr:CBS domain-containing protein [Myxococcota bacterium]
MSIVSYCRRPACTASPQETLLAAAQRMAKEGIGLLVVTEGERLVGVLTDRDVAMHAAARGRDASGARITDAMSSSPVSVEAEASLEEAVALMRARRVRRLPVLDPRERVAGVVSADDLTRLLAREIAGLGEVLTAQLPAGGSGVVVGEAPHEPPWGATEHYVRDVVTAPASASIAELARRMQDASVGSVVALDDDEKAIGLVTDRDVALRVVAAGLDPSTTVASTIMSAPLIGADPSEPLEEVVERMRTASVRRIPILSEGRPVGIVTVDDLLVTFGHELDQLGACVAEEIRGARIQTQRGHIRDEIEQRLEEAAAQLLELGDQTLRTLSSELEQAFHRVVRSLGWSSVGAGGRVEVRVGDLMQADVRTCTSEDALSEPARIMWERDCGCVPVEASDGSGRVVGMITDRDIGMAAYTSGGRLAEIRVGDAMATRVHSCRVEDPVSEAMRIMRTAQVRRLPVVDGDGHLRGVLSLADLTEGAAGRRAPAGRVSELHVAQTLEAISRSRSHAE